MVDSPAYRLNHEEVIKALEEGIAFAENLNPIEAVPDERGAVEGDDLQAGGRGRGRTGRTAGHAARADGARRRRHVAEHHVREGSAGHVPARREEEVLPAARASTNGDGRFHLTPDPERLLHVVRRATAGSSPTTATTIRATPATSSRRWRRRRTASRTSSSCSRASCAALDPAAQPQRDARLGAPHRAPRRRSHGARRGRRAADADDRRGHREGAGGGAALPSRASSTGCRTTSRWPGASTPTAQRAAPDGGHRADRRVGGQGAGAAVAHRARARRVEPARARTCSKGEPVVVMGPTGTPTEIPERQNVLLLGGGLGNAVLFSIAKAMRDARQQGDLLRRLQEGRGPLQARGDRGGDRSGDLEHRHRRADRARAARRTRTSAATSCRRCSPIRRASSGSALVPLDTVDRIIAIGSDRMMAAVKAARHGVLAPHLKPDHVGIAQHQLADAVHDERGLRAVPAEARRSGDGQGDDHLLLLQPGSGAWTAWTSRTSRRACARTPCRRSSRNLWLDHLLRGQDGPHV